MTTPQEDEVSGETVWTIRVEKLLKEIKELKEEMGWRDDTTEG
jgi:hypothetical protein